MIHFASNCLLNFALSLAKVHIATEQPTVKGIMTIINATSAINSAVVSPELLEFVLDMPKRKLDFNKL